MAKKTNKMRIQLDFVIEFKDPINSLPMGNDTDIKLLYDYLTKALRVAAYYDALRSESVLECPCGFLARGSTWEETGTELDAHLDEVPDE